MPIPLGVLAVAGAGAAGGGAAFDLLETTLISSNTASVTFSNLNNYSDYKHLQVRVASRTSDASEYGAARIRLNGDTSDATNYRYHQLYGKGTNVLSTGETQNYFETLGASANASAFGVSVVDILDFGNSSKNTTIRLFTGQQRSSNPRINLDSILWNNTAAVTSVSFVAVANFVSGSRFSLYGIK